jgi:hypothetical protein
VLHFCGWCIQWKKTICSPSTSLLHQGFITDSMAKRYFITSDKWQKIHQHITTVHAAAIANNPVSITDVASLLGCITALCRSHGLVTAVMSRSLQHQLGLHTFISGWSGSLTLSAASIAELTFLKDNLHAFHGLPIPTATAVSHIYEISDTLQVISGIIRTDKDSENLYVSDASDTHAFVYRADRTFSFVEDCKFDTQQSSASSSVRELLVLLFILHRDAKHLANRNVKLIYWQTQTDSQCSARFILFGSCRPQIQKIVLEIKLLEFSLQIQIQPVWTPRSHPRMILADMGSKIRSRTDEWSVRQHILAAVFVETKCIPTVDAFATAANAICPTYFSVIPQPAFTGVNFFAQKLLPTQIYLCCPPVKLLPAALKHVCHHQSVTALFVLPEWHSASFWPIFFPNGRQHLYCTFVHRFTGGFFSAYGTKSLFTSGAIIPMVAILLRTPSLYNVQISGN